MSIKANYPTIRPSLNLDFANTKRLDPRVTFSRASTATYVDANGVIQTAAANTPRFDHDPSTGESLGLLIEEARTNLLTYSEQFDNAAWTKGNATVTANATVAPDGNTTADKLIASNGTTRGRLQFSDSNTSTKTVSVYAKAAEWSFIGVGFGNGSGVWSIAVFNLSTGAYSNTSNFSTPTISSYSITSVGNGWYRVSATITGSSDAAVIMPASASGDIVNPAWTGNGTSGVFIWGAQLESGSFPSSYIPTTTATVTRSADVAQMTGTNFSSWYRQDEGTIVAEYPRNSSQVAASSVAIVTLNNATVNEDISIFWAYGSYALGQVVAGYATQALIQTQTISLGKIKNALSYKLNDFALCGNGGTVVTDTSGNLASPTQMQIGTKTAYSSNATNGPIARLAFYPKRLTNAQLQSLTAN